MINEEVLNNLSLDDFNDLAKAMIEKQKQRRYELIKQHRAMENEILKCTEIIERLNKGFIKSKKLVDSAGDGKDDGETEGVDNNEDTATVGDN